MKSGNNTAKPIFHRLERIAEYGIVGYAAYITIPYPQTPSSPLDDGILCLHFNFSLIIVEISCDVFHRNQNQQKKLPSLSQQEFSENNTFLFLDVATGF